jgi:tetratricopeptide (TPR) repeat protein
MIMFRSVCLLLTLCIPTLIATTSSACPMERGPRLLVKYYKKAQHAEKKKHYQKALRLYQRAMHTDRSASVQFKSAMGASRLAKGLKRFQVMERALRFAIKRRPNKAKAHADLGFALVRIKPAEAVKSLVRAAELGVKNPGDVLAAIAEGLAGQGQLTAAKRTLHRALKAKASRKRIRWAREVIGKSTRAQSLVKN